MADVSRIVIKGGRVMSEGADPHDPAVADVYIEGSDIAAVVAKGAGPPPPAFAAPGTHVIDATDRLVLPGFVNAHYHSHDAFLKGWFEPMPLELWVLNVIPKLYPKPSKAALRARTLLGALECLRSGITTMQDMVTLSPPDEEAVETVIAAYDEIGIRVVLGLQVIDVSPLETTPFWRELIPAEKHALIPPTMPPEMAQGVMDRIEAEVVKRRPERSRLTWALTPSGPERTSRPLLERMAALAEDCDLPVFTHLYTSKAEAVFARQRFGSHDGSLVRFLEDVGLLSPRLTVAHGVWLGDDEIAALAKAGASLVHNPISNLKNKNGVAPVRALMEAGVNVAIGCDNCSCSDTQNMFQGMKMLALLAAVTDPRPGRPDAVDAMRAATAGGARAMRLDGRIGAIRRGLKADLAIIDLTGSAFVPLNSVARQLVYGESGADVETVIVDGRVVMQDRRITTIDEAALRAAVAEAMPAFREDARAVIGRNATMAEAMLEADRRVWAEDVGLDRYVGR